MTTTLRPPATRRAPTAAKRVPMDSVRKTALWAGVLYVITFAASIPAKFFLLDPAFANADFMTRPGLDNALLWGGFLDLITGLAGIGTAVALYSVVKKQHEGLALGFVTTRIFEAAVIVIGVVSLLAVVTLRQDLAGAAGTDAAALATTGNALAAIYGWTFLIGPGVMAGVNALLLGTLMYRSRLVPRAIPVMGLIGAPLILVSVIAAFFGLHDLTSATHTLAVLPIFVWELSLGVYMAVKGFKPSPITATSVPAAPVREPVPVA